MPNHPDTASANNMGENSAWQFQSSTGRANRTAAGNAAVSAIAAR